MAKQFSVAVRNAMLDAKESTIGLAAHLVFLSGTKPANCAAAETGTRLGIAILPSDWESNASAGSKAKLGTWQVTAVIANGTVGYYRIYDALETACGEQGTVTVTSGGGDMEIDNVVMAIGETITVTAYSETAGNA